MRAADGRRRGGFGPLPGDGQAGDDTVLEADPAVRLDGHGVRGNYQALAAALHLDAEALDVHSGARLADLVLEGGVHALPFALELDLEEGGPAAAAAHFIHATVEGQRVAVELVRDLEVVLVARLEDEDLLAILFLLFAADPDAVRGPWAGQAADPDAAPEAGA
jgi:hypothetical protein